MKHSIQLLLTLACLSLANNSFALKSDREQPAEIQADNTEIDFQSGTRTLTDNVLVSQGTLRLKADKLVAIYTKDGDLSKATAWGSLARFKQRPDDKPDDVEGWGKKMVVDYTTNTLTRIGSAALKQGGSTARGDTIVYNMSTDKLRIIGGSKINTQGKATAPKPKIVDPFDDDNQGPKVAPNNTNKDHAFKNEIEPESSQTPVSTTPSGRSRLIIQPKAVKK